ncbi:MAG: hypothetical protein JRG92_15940, partial [Deltaproteobacteria bacterium]|nr:hypothetical protein [Deltaproteobacteria bacterium]
AAGLRDTDRRVTPGELLADFSWDRVAAADRLMVWDGERLTTRGDATLAVVAEP